MQQPIGLKAGETLPLKDGQIPISHNHIEKSKFEARVTFAEGEKPVLKSGEPFNIMINGTEIVTIFKEWQNGEAVFIAWIEIEKYIAITGGV